MILGARHLFLGAFALPLMAAQQSVPERHADISKALFDYCPKIFVGQISLTDDETVRSLGYTVTEPRETPDGKIPRAERGTGSEKIVISGHASEKNSSCAVWFGGPDTKSVMKHLGKEAIALKYMSGVPMPLGDGTLIYKMVREGSEPRAITVILADTGGQLEADVGPAVTLILMNESN